MRFASYVLAAAIAASSIANAAVLEFDVSSRQVVAGGQAFGPAGSYERQSGTVRYAVDPANEANRIIADIGLAPRDAQGRVEFTADFYLLRPTNMENANGTLLLEVSNRGRKGLISFFDHGPASLDPAAPEDFGDGFLFASGYTLLWIGWQFDVPEREDLLKVHVPIAMANGEPVTGLVRSDFVVREPASYQSLGDGGHVPYPAADANAPANVLTVRDTPLGARTLIPRNKWRFARIESRRVVASSTDLYLEDGFEPHRIYELVYVGRNAGVAGLGLAAIRDAVSQIKFEGADALGIDRGALPHAIAFGLSQSGRLLRQFVYDGFNADERGRKVFDGLMPHIAGGARGSFNHRFAQPSRASASYFYPNAIFPFADQEQSNPETGETAGLLTRLSANQQPKIIYTNSSNEYWRGTAALTHVSVDGKSDLAELDNVRRYLFAGTQHVPASFPPAERTGQQAANPNDYTWFLRALLVALDDWIRQGKPPPPSRHPMLADGTLIAFEKLEFPKLPGLLAPQILHGAVNLDFGPRFASDGIITREPPAVGHAYPILLPQIDTDGNEIAGLRSPAQAVPLASYTGWNLFDPAHGPAGELVSLQGSYLPFPLTAADAVAARDPRKPIGARYASRSEYLRLIHENAESLAETRYLLESDIPAIVAQAGEHWDFLAD